MIFFREAAPSQLLLSPGLCAVGTDPILSHKGSLWLTLGIFPGSSVEPLEHPQGPFCKAKMFSEVSQMPFTRMSKVDDGKT